MEAEYSSEFWHEGLEELPCGWKVGSLKPRAWLDEVKRSTNPTVTTTAVVPLSKDLLFPDISQVAVIMGRCQVCTQDIVSLRSTLTAIKKTNKQKKSNHKKSHLLRSVGLPQNKQAR